MLREKNRYASAVSFVNSRWTSSAVRPPAYGQTILRARSRGWDLADTLTKYTSGRRRGFRTRVHYRGSLQGFTTGVHYKGSPQGFTTRVPRRGGSAVPAWCGRRLLPTSASLQ